MTSPEEAHANFELDTKAGGTDYRGLLDEAQTDEASQEHDVPRERLHQLPVPASHQAEILLVAHGLKPATFDLVRLGTPKYDALVTYAEQANIPFTTMHSPDAGDDSVVIGYGHSAAAANEVAQAFWSEPAELGVALGFPATAVEAYANKTYLSLEEEATVIPDETLAPFLSFRLSREHWQEELQVAKAWRDGVKDLDPELFRAVVEEEKAKRGGN